MTSPIRRIQLEAIYSFYCQHKGNVGEKSWAEGMLGIVYYTNEWPARGENCSLGRRNEAALSSRGSLQTLMGLGEPRGQRSCIVLFADAGDTFVGLVSLCN